MPVWPNGSKNIPRVSYEFGMRTNPVTGVYKLHAGIDLIGWDTIVSPVNGTIIYAGYNGGFGNLVQIREDGTRDVVYLAHNRAFIRTSGRVTEGQPVAYMGSTGQSTGKHCHFETHPKGGSAINPRTWMTNRNSATANLGSGQRTAKMVINRRTEPTSKSAIAGDPLQPGTVGNFVGWIHGEKVEGNDVWYKGTSGNWFWSGGFKEGANGTGLKDLNPTSIGKTQRQADGNGVRRRSEPSSKSTEKSPMLAPNEIGNFNGWIRGESVSGNNVWFRGISGDWFWSGGFTDKGTHDLTDLNAPTKPALEPNQRTAGSDGVNRRSAPSSKAPMAGALLAPGTVGNFVGWSDGESVNGNTLWYKGTSGNWFWSGAFVQAPTKTGLAHTPYTEPTPDPDPEPSDGVRTVGAASANGRSGPYRTQAIVTVATNGSKIEMDAWTTGEAVEGNSVWFRKKGTATWFWSGGFTDKTATGLLRVEYTGPTGPKELAKFYPGALTRYEVQMGGVRNKDTNVLEANRPAGGDAIRRIWVHHAASTSDQLNYFLGRNERKSCPTVYVRTGGQLIEFVPYSQRPWSTGAADADALTVETQNTSGDPNWGISEASHEAIAQWIAWVAKQDRIDGLKVDFFPTADTVKGHNAAPGAATACPGPSMNIPWIIARAQTILAEVSEPGEPADPENPGEVGDVSEIKAAWREYKNALAAVEPSFAKLDALLK